MISKNAGGNIR